MRRLLAATLLAAACTSDSVVGRDPYTDVVELPATPNTKLDLLFVIDDSDSMFGTQPLLVASLPQMMHALEDLDGTLPDIHIAVTTPNLGVSTQTTPGSDVEGCTGSGRDGAFRTHPGGWYLSDIDDGNGGRTRNYTGDLAAAFQELASVGTAGCGFEQHLGAMKRSLENPLNAGFLRADANLAVIIVADEDDCTAQGPGLFEPTVPGFELRSSFRCTEFGVVCDQSWDELGEKTNCAPVEDSPLVAGVQPFIDSLLALKEDPRQIMVAAIVGDPSRVSTELSPLPGSLVTVPQLNASCGYQVDPTPQDPIGWIPARPAVRIAAFLDGFPGYSQLATICQGDLSGPLDAIGDTTRKLMGDPCIDTSNLADSSPAAGIQPTCEVLDESATTSRAVPACTRGSDTDCYELVTDAARCPRSADHLKLVVRRSHIVPASTWTRLRCIGGV